MKNPIPPQLPRYLVQAGYLGFMVWLAIRFSRWVAEVSASPAPSLPRPAAIDGFLPISGLAGLRHWLQAGELFPVHPAAPLILLAALLTAALLKRGFCSWVCPVFPLSEGLWRLGRRLFGRNLAPPFWIDLPLRSLKYLLLGFFVVQLLWMMPLPALRSFLGSGYHVVADIRLFQFFQHPSLTLLVVLGILALLSLVVQMPWCRYLCPYGALLGLVSMASLCKIGRREQLCTRCGLCSARCPAWLPVMAKRTVRSPECYACFRCVHNCPAAGAVAMRLSGRRTVPSWIFGLAVVALFAGMALIGNLTGNWQGAPGDALVHQILRSP